MCKLQYFQAKFGLLGEGCQKAHPWHKLRLPDKFQVPAPTLRWTRAFQRKGLPEFFFNMDKTEFFPSLILKHLNHFGWNFPKLSALGRLSTENFSPDEVWQSYTQLKRSVTHHLPALLIINHFQPGIEGRRLNTIFFTSFLFKLTCVKYF